MDFLNLNYFENKHNKLYPNKPIKVTKRDKTYIYFETEFGNCKKRVNDFNKSFDIRSALNKTDFLKKQLYKINKNKYDLSLVKYNSNKEKIILICKKHGKLYVTISNAVSGKAGCMKCSGELTKQRLKSNIKEFVKKANKVHNFKYNYSEAEYSTVHEKIKIICIKHGIFKQESNAHLQGQGCPKCSRIKIKNYNIKNPTGWTLTNWEKSGNKSKNFDGFKVYIIKCWNEEEEFYKIGRTYKKINYRFSKSTIPYNYKVIKIIKNTACIIYKLENEMKNNNTINKYIPKIKFGGMYECFTKINNL